MWNYQMGSRAITSQMNGGQYCLTSAGGLQVEACNGSAAQRWWFQDSKLRSDSGGWPSVR